MLVLLNMFYPLVTSLHGLQQTSELTKVQKKPGCGSGKLQRVAAVEVRRTRLWNDRT